MPLPILNAAARVMCIHGGQATIIPKQFVVMASGEPVLAEGDMIGTPIVGCGLPVTGVTVPCTAIVSEMPMPGAGQSIVAMCGGRPVLLEGLMCVTDSVPPGTTFVAFPGQIIALA